MRKLYLVVAVAVLAGCGAKPVTEADFDRIANYYFDLKLTQAGIEWDDYQVEEDIIINSKSCYCLSAVNAEDEVVYSIGIMKDGSGVYNYGMTTGKATRIGGSEVGR